MKHSYSFYIDNKLRINFWGKRIAEYTGKTSSSVLGKKYYEVLPRIFIDDKDAIAISLKENRPLTLKDYCFNCLSDQIRADIKINLEKTESPEAKRVKVDIYPYSTCALAKKLQNSQRLIDIGRIASTFAHGVRNPLNAIKGAVIYIRQRYVNEPTLIEFTTIMEEEISRLDNFVSRFLSTSVIEARLSETDVNSLLKKIEIYTSLQARTCNIKSVYQYGDIPAVMINTFQLEQAILNVINNAIEAMSSGGQLTVKTESERRSGTEFAKIEIVDTGSGMEKGKNEELTVPSRNKGKGFGLFITREILQFYGGHLEIKSKKGSGTTVRLYLPVKKD
ncbi:MAG: ATP-binding protein [Nitrospirota bacterium]